jgi:hypothetical protein
LLHLAMRQPFNTESAAMTPCANTMQAALGRIFVDTTMLGKQEEAILDADPASTARVSDLDNG